MNTTEYQEVAFALILVLPTPVLTLVKLHDIVHVNITRKKTRLTRVKLYASNISHFLQLDDIRYVVTEDKY